MKQDFELTQTRIRINKRIFRMGMEARPLLIVLSTMLISGTILIGAFGYLGGVLCVGLVYAFIKLKNYLTTEIEKGNLDPFDSFLMNLNKAKSLENDDVIEILKSRRFGKTK